MSPGPRNAGRVMAPKSATRPPPNTHPNPLSGWDEDRPDPEDIEADLARLAMEEHQ